MRSNGFLFMMLVLLAGLCGLSAQTFEADGLRFSVLSENDRTVTLIHGGVDDGYLSGVRSVVVPENVTDQSTGRVYTVAATEGAFVDLEDIEEISPPNTITSIRHDFVMLPNLVSLNLPESLVSVQGFYTLPKLAELKFPESLQSIGDESFVYVGLKEVILPENLTVLNYGVFTDMPDLERIEMPGVEYVGTYVLSRCAGLKKIVFARMFQNE